MTNITVVVPHFKSFSLLSRLLSTIPASYYVVVVDDYSDPKEFEIYKKNNESEFIKLIKNSGPKGAGNCRNIGLKYVETEFVIFSDADDTFVSDSYFVLSTATLNTLDDIIYFPPTSLGIDGRTSGSRHKKYEMMVIEHLQKSTYLSELRLRLTYNVPWSKVYRTSFLKGNNIQFDGTIVANDGMFSARAGRFAKSISCFKKPFYCSILTNNSLTTTKNLDNYYIRLNVFCNYYDFLSEKERSYLEVSPLPILYTGLEYGLFNFFKFIYFFHKRGISIFKNFKFNKRKLRLLIK
ncbi:glycosyltransferase [Vibrio breoganii]